MKEGEAEAALFSLLVIELALWISTLGRTAGGTARYRLRENGA